MTFVWLLLISYKTLHKIPYIIRIAVACRYIGCIIIEFAWWLPDLEVLRSIFIIFVMTFFVWLLFINHIMIHNTPYIIRIAVACRYVGRSLNNSWLTLRCWGQIPPFFSWHLCDYCSSVTKRYTTYHRSFESPLHVDMLATLSRSLNNSSLTLRGARFRSFPLLGAWHTICSLL